MEADLEVEATEPIDQEEGCRQCGALPAQTESYMAVMSFVVFSRWNEYQDLLCRDCSTRTAIKEQAKSALLGWWGVPWGLLTFKALWVNTRTLLSWSTYSRPMALLMGVMGLGLPLLLGWGVVKSSSERQQYKATGDWVDAEAVKIFDQGHKKLAAGEVEAALELYLKAHKMAPKSSIVNDYVSYAYSELGLLEAALPYSAAATRIDPKSVEIRIQYGWLLARLGDLEASRQQAELLAGHQPRDDFEADRMAAQCRWLADYDCALEHAVAGLLITPEHTGLQFEQLAALVELDRLDEAAELLDGLSPEVLEVRADLALYAQVYELRTAAAEDLGELVAGVLQSPAAEGYAERFVAACERAGHLDEMRRQVSVRLLAGKTPATEWANAGMWFEPQQLADLLDQYLAENTAMTPGLLRLGQLDFLREEQQIFDLAQRLRHLDDPQTEEVDQYYYAVLRGQLDAGEYRRQLEEHLVTYPEHGFCRALRMDLLAEVAPTEFWSEIEAEKEAGAGNPLLRAGLEYTAAKAQFAMPGSWAARRTAESVRDQFGDWLDEHQLKALIAEAEFHGGSEAAALEQTIDRSLGNPAAEAGFVAALLVLRWSTQLAQTEPLTYRADADRWLERFSASAEGSLSPSARGVLAAEGLIDRATAVGPVTGWRQGTVSYVRALRDLAADPSRLSELLQPIAADPNAPGSFSARLARRVLQRRELAAE